MQNNSCKVHCNPAVSYNVYIRIIGMLAFTQVVGVSMCIYMHVMHVGVSVYM